MECAFGVAWKGLASERTTLFSMQGTLGDRLMAPRIVLTTFVGLLISMDVSLMLAYQTTWICLLLKGKTIDVLRGA